MREVKLYNSLTREEEVLEPSDGETVRIYHCGPTVYKRPHLGNMRRFLFADFLVRALKLNRYEVKQVMNITDVGHLTQDDIDQGEDKLEKEAREQNLQPQDIAEQVTEQFIDDLEALNIEPADEYPKATDHIPEMISIIEQLLEREHAYQTDSGVYFDVTSFENYGKLSGNTLDNIEAGARVEVREDKKHPADFALWVRNDPEHLQQWDSPWGKGYPGWHIECSAMAEKYLGSSIDIHTGGEDNKFPHHENEIAQSECASGEQFVKIWMHNAHLTLGEAKMAKSEGEVLSVDSLREIGYSPIVFRLLVFGSHYRSKMKFSWEAMEEAQALTDSISQLVRQLNEKEVYDGRTNFNEDILGTFTAALARDINTPEALAVLVKYMHWANGHIDSDTQEIWATLLEMDKVVGIIGPVREELDGEQVPEKIRKLADEREKARADNNFAEADKLREEIEAAGHVLEDTPSGPRVKKK